MTPPAFDAPVREIADQMRNWAVRTDSRLEATRAPSSGEAFGVSARSPQRATLGWGASKDLPRLEVSRSNGILQIDFVLDHQTDRNGKIEPRAWRRAIAYGSAGLVGELLVERALRDPALSFHCREHPTSRIKGECPITGTDTLRRHWVWAKGAPVLRWKWTQARMAGRASSWLREPGLLFGSLLAQVLADGDTAPPLLIPPPTEKTFDAFISFPGRGGREAACLLRRALVNRGHDVWLMDDHQRAGDDIGENNEGGVSRSRTFIALLSREYWASRHCCGEFIAAAAFGIRPLALTLIPAGCDVRTAMSGAGIEQPAQAERALRDCGADDSVIQVAKKLYESNRPGVRVDGGIDEAVIDAVTDALTLTQMDRRRPARPGEAR